MGQTESSILHLAMDRALQVALEAHGGQLRRGSDAPYVIHPIQVALALSGLGASVTVIQAGVLHDVVEDCEDWTCARIHVEFGAQVAGLVAEVTEDKSLSWKVRKEHGIQVVPELSEGALLIKACDKLHNLTSLAASLESVEDAALVWGRFRGKREGTLETSGRLVEALCLRVSSDLGEQLRSALGRVRQY